MNKKAAHKERLSHIADIALEVVENLLTDTETSIETRLNTAFKIFEMYGKQPIHKINHTIVKGIENNAYKLAVLQTLLEDKGQNHESSGRTIEIITNPSSAWDKCSCVNTGSAAEL